VAKEHCAVVSVARAHAVSGSIIELGDDEVVRVHRRHPGVRVGIPIYGWAVSIGHGDTMLRDQLFEGLDRLSPVERLAWSAIQFCRYFIKFVLSVQG
jgi:hypothetical protein